VYTALATSLTIGAACSSQPDNSGYRPIRTPTPQGAQTTVQIATPQTGVTVVTQDQQTDGNAPGIPILNGPVQSSADGLRSIEERPGSGETPQTGQKVNVHYTGWLTNGQKFDSSVDRNQPFSFTLGQGQVIKGWDEGVAMMKVGEKSR